MKTNLTLGFLFFGLERIGIPIFFDDNFNRFCLEKETTLSIPILFYGLFMISQTEWSDDLIPRRDYFFAEI